MSDQRDPSRPGWTTGPGGGGPPGEGSRGWMEQPGGQPQQGSPWQGGHGGGGQGGPQWQGGGGPARGPQGGGNGPGTGVIVAIGVTLVVLVLAGIGIIGYLVVGREDRTVTIQGSVPTTSGPPNPPPTTSGGGVTTTRSMVTGPRETAGGGGAKATSIDGRMSADVPGGWTYQASQYASSSSTIRLTPPISSGSFDETYLGVTISETQSYGRSAAETASSRKNLGTGKEVGSLPSRQVLGERAESWSETRDAITGNRRTETRLWLVVRGDKQYEIRTYGSREANRRWSSDLGRVLDSLQVR